MLSFWQWIFPRYLCMFWCASFCTVRMQVFDPPLAHAIWLCPWLVQSLLSSSVVVSADLEAGTPWKDPQLSFDTCMMEKVVVTCLHAFMVKNETLNPGRATTKENFTKDYFTKDYFLSREFQSSKIRYYSLNSLWLCGKQYLLVSWFESLHFTARSFARSTCDRARQLVDQPLKWGRWGRWGAHGVEVPSTLQDDLGWRLES